MIPTAVAAPLRPPKSMVAVPERRPCVPVTVVMMTTAMMPIPKGLLSVKNMPTMAAQRMQ